MQDLLTTLTRRSFLGGLSVVVTVLGGGCVGRDPTPYNLLVQCYSEADRTLDLTVQNVDSNRTVLDRSLSLSDGDRVTEEDVFETEFDYRLTATVGGQTFEDDFDPGDDGNAPVSAFHVVLRDDGSVDFFLPAP